MNWIKRRIASWLLRSYQKELSLIKGQLDKKEEILLFSGLYQNAAFRKYLSTRENALVLQMANELKKPSNEDFVVLYGRRLELMDLYIHAREVL